MKTQKTAVPTFNARIPNVTRSRIDPIIIPLFIGLHNLGEPEPVQNYFDLPVTGNFPKKPFLDYINPKKEIVNIRAAIRVRVCVQNTLLQFIFKYDEKTVTGKGKYSIQEKEKVFLTDASRETVIEYAERYFGALNNSNSPQDFENVKKWFNDWAHPLTLESVIESLDEKQKLKAAQILDVYFNG